MELTENKKEKGIWKLPKNVRQIGEPGSSTRILIEDYAYTYLHQMAEQNLTCMKTAVLLGNAEDGRICIQAAVEADMGQDQKKWFTNEQWRDVFAEVQQWFSGLEVVGWFLSNPGFPVQLTEELRTLHEKHFPSDKHVLFLMDVMENDADFFIKSDVGLTAAPGYYIYYEKNDTMQAYMSEQRGGAGIEPEGILRDRAAAKFRSVMMEKKEQNSQKKMLTFLYTASTFLVLVILVIGVTMMNNYDRMTNMETAIHQISQTLDQESTEQNQDTLEQQATEENQEALANQEAAGIAAEELGDARSNEDAAEAAGDDGEGTAEEAAGEDTEEDLTEDPENTSSGENATGPQSYEVRKGDTLLGICRNWYGDETKVGEICALNGLDDGDHIYAGQILLLP